ncbi:MAG: hypothetical protein HY876_06445 [Coriobacteriales bacterium]|nr:hypothetical protein [Coriobacteriales bacterium]
MPGYALVSLLAVAVLFAAAVCIGCTELACDHHDVGNSLQVPGSIDVMRVMTAIPAAMPPSAIASLVVSALLVLLALRSSADSEPVVVPLRV